MVKCYPFSLRTVRSVETGVMSGYSVSSSAVVGSRSPFLPRRLTRVRVLAGCRGRRRAACRHCWCTRPAPSSATLSGWRTSWGTTSASATSRASSSSKCRARRGLGGIPHRAAGEYRKGFTARASAHLPLVPPRRAMRMLHCTVCRRLLELIFLLVSRDRRDFHMFKPATLAS